LFVAVPAPYTGGRSCAPPSRSLYSRGVSRRTTRISLEGLPSRRRCLPASR
jgi:hypothetical protein